MRGPRAYETETSGELLS